MATTRWAGTGGRGPGMAIAPEPSCPAEIRMRPPRFEIRLACPAGFSMSHEQLTNPLWRPVWRGGTARPAADRQAAQAGRKELSDCLE